MKTNNLPQTSLSAKDCKAIRDHFSKKQTFYKKQDTTRWMDWPDKSTPRQKPANKKRTNHKKRVARNRRKLEKVAKRLKDDGSIVILVNEDIPDAAIAVLGKGLGFDHTHTISRYRRNKTGHEIIHKQNF